MQHGTDILDVDLGKASFHRRPRAETLVREVLGGRGLIARWLVDEVPANTAPLSPANPLYVCAGLLTGSPAPSAARLHLGACSPLTGYLGSASIGGTTGPALAALGLGSLALRGAAAEPVYLYLDAEGAEIRDASRVWGLETPQAARALQEECGADSVMLLIGPAGENRAPMACVVTHKGHAAGRTGLGAVMGSKNLKAVVISPGRAPSWPINDAARAAIKEYVSKIRASTSYREYTEFGSTSGVSWTSHMGMLATRNYQAPQFEEATDIDGRSLSPYVTRTRACHRCPVHCKAEIEVQTGTYAGLRGERPDFEPLVSLGSKVGLADPEAVMYLHNLCDWLGLDSVSVGGALAFAMELWQRGLLTAADTDGLELCWGDAQLMESVIRQMAAGEGLGGLLGQGVRRAAAIIGRGAEHYALEVKGLELTAFDPRGVYATALGYAVSSRGGDYASVYARHEYEVDLQRARALYGDERAADRLSPIGKASMVRRSLTSSAVLDALGLCKVPALTLVNEYDLVNESKLVSGLTGTEMTPEDLFLAGERILVLERLFNLRFGAAAEEDTLPELFLTEPMPDGPARGSLVELAPMLQEFYALMGWTEQGVPTTERLAELGLAAYAAMLEEPASKPGRNEAV